MVSTKLNHLHILCLLRMAVVRPLPESDPQLIDVSARMLSLVVEAAVLKDHLANSGTSLVWKVGRLPYMNSVKLTRYRLHIMV